MSKKKPLTEVKGLNRLTNASESSYLASGEIDKRVGVLSMRLLSLSIHSLSVKRFTQFGFPRKRDLGLIRDELRLEEWTGVLKNRNPSATKRLQKAFRKGDSETLISPLGFLCSKTHLKAYKGIRQ